MSYRHILVCDGCGFEVENDPDDGQPDGWGINVDNDDFCPTCVLTLDPYDPEQDENASLTPHQRHVRENIYKHVVTVTPLPQ